MSFLAVFDVDGTLIDSQHHIVAAMNHAHDSAGHVRPPRDQVLNIVGLSLPEAFRRLHPALEDTAHALLVARYREAFSALRTAGRAEADSPLYPGVADGLARMAARAGLLLGTATGKSRRGLDSVISAHGLAGHFATLQCADGHPSKPHPSMLQAALAETGGTPGRAAMIGDTEYDMAMGKAAGMTAIGVGWGYHSAERLIAAGADHLVADFAALEALVEALAA